MVQHDLPTAVRSGAIIIGKTNVRELTLWPWTESTTWGTTRNPWNRNRTPGGSSGGSAAAVCTGMAAMALGSDGGGSIRYPAGLTGLVGLKPQRDRIPVGDEHGSGWHGLITLGPLTRSARDAALFLDVASNSPSPIDARLGSRIRRPCCGLWRPRRRGLGRRDGSQPWKPPTHLVGVRPSHQVFDQLALD
jgi:amidase